MKYQSPDEGFHLDMGNFAAGRLLKFSKTGVHGAIPIGKQRNIFLSVAVRRG
jgi:hypothetical protein